MTLTRTIRRREKRKRAKAAAAERQRRWDAMSPDERAFIEYTRRVFAEDAIATLTENLKMASFFSREYK